MFGIALVMYIHVATACTYMSYASFVYTRNYILWITIQIGIQYHVNVAIHVHVHIQVNGKIL